MEVGMNHAFPNRLFATFLIFLRSIVMLIILVPELLVRMMLHHCLSKPEPSLFFHLFNLFQKVCYVTMMGDSLLDFLGSYC